MHSRQEAKRGGVSENTAAGACSSPAQRTTPVTMCPCQTLTSPTPQSPPRRSVPGRPMLVVVCVAHKLRPCPSYSRRRDRINLGLWRSLYKGGGVPPNDQRDEAVILSHTCRGPGAPPFGRPPDTPPPPPPPRPSLKVAGKWKGVGVSPVAMPPPCCLYALRGAW